MVRRVLRAGLSGDTIKGPLTRGNDALPNLFHDPMPDRVEPCLALLASIVPVGPGWACPRRARGKRAYCHQRRTGLVAQLHPTESDLIDLHPRDPRIRAIVAVAAIPVVLDYLYLGDAVERLISLGRWPALIVLLMVGLAALYRFGPSRDDAQWNWVSPGAIFASVTWLLGSVLFSWYVASFEDYNKTYGALGAVIALLMWMCCPRQSFSSVQS